MYSCCLPISCNVKLLRKGGRKGSSRQVIIIIIIIVVIVGAFDNPRMHATWLIGALFEFLTRIAVHFPATALTPHPPSV